MIDAGLILEGGGMRGIYTAGVLDLLMDEGLMFKHIYGVSAGACHACSYLSGQRGRAMRTNTQYLKDKRYASFYSLLTTGDFFGEQLVYKEIPNIHIPFDYDAFSKSGAEFFAVVTNVETGLAEYLPVTDLRREMDVIRASSSLPLLSRIVPFGGKKYLDGGIADSIPLARSMQNGNSKNLVVLTRHKGYQKRKDPALALSRLKYRKYPNFVNSLKTRHERYNEALALVHKEEESGNALVIQPLAPVEIRRLEKDKERLLALYNQGIAEAKAMLPAICAFIEGL